MLSVESLRNDGYSFTDISNILNISRSKAYRIGKDIKIINKRKKKRKRNMNSYRNFYKNKRLSYQEDGRIKAKEKKLEHAMACMLYWAEGSKERNCCKIVNTDVNMLIFFISFLRNEFHIDDEKISLRIAYYENLNKESLTDFWIKSLDLKKENVKGYTVKKNKSNNIKHPNGICTIIVNSTHIVQHIYGAIQEYMSFSDEKFLW